MKTKSYRLMLTMISQNRYFSIFEKSQKKTKEIFFEKRFQTSKKKTFREKKLIYRVKTFVHFHDIAKIRQLILIKKFNVEKNTIFIIILTKQYASTQFVNSRAIKLHKFIEFDNEIAISNIQKTIYIDFINKYKREFNTLFE